MNKSKINTFIKFLGFIVVLQNSVFGQNAISLDLVQPTFTENCANGSVSLTITGGEAPFDIIWTINSDQGIETILNENSLSNLIAGSDINLLVTDSNCSTSEVDLETICECETLNTSDFEYDIIHQCGSNQLGSISIYTPTSEVVWTTGDIGPTIDNLVSGVYMAWVTDLNDCVNYLVFFVDDIENNFNPKIVNLSIDKPCENESNGSISFDFNGILGGVYAPNYNIWWNDDPTNSDTQRDGLSRGTYTVNISDDCNEPKSFELYVGNPFYSAQYSLIEGCELSAYIIDNQGNSPIQVEWSSGQNGQSVDLPDANAFYNYSITDSNDCTVVGEIGPMSSSDFISYDISVTKSCEHEAEGTALINIELSQPCTYRIEIVRPDCPDCTPLLTQSGTTGAGEIEMDVSHLGVGPWEAKIEYCGCILIAPFNIDTIEPDLVYSGEHEDLGNFEILCNYEASCNGQELDPIQQPAGVSYDGSKCCGEIKYFCDEQNDFWTQEIERIKIRAVQAVELIETAENNEPGFIPQCTGTIEDLDEIQDITKICRYVKLCPDNPCCNTDLKLGIRKFKTFDCLSNGCKVIVCKNAPEEEIVICNGCNVLPNYLLNAASSMVNCPLELEYGEFINCEDDCIRVSQPLGAMLSTMDVNLLQPGFANSPLHQWLVNLEFDNSTQWANYVNIETLTAEELIWATRWCNQVNFTVCREKTSDGEIINKYYFNSFKVENGCIPPEEADEADNYCEPTPDDGVCRTMCAPLGSFCCPNANGIYEDQFLLDFICDGTQIVTPPNAEPEDPELFLCKGKEFIRFIEVPSDVGIGYCGAIKTNFKKITTYVYDFSSHPYEDSHKVIMSDIRDDKEIFLVQTTKHENEYEITLESEDSQLIVGIESDNKISFQSLTVKDGICNVSGYFNGTLNYAGATILSSNVKTWFEISFEINEAKILSSQTIPLTGINSFSDGIYFVKKSESSINYYNKLFNLSNIKIGNYLIIDKAGHHYEVNIQNQPGSIIKDIQSNQTGLYVLMSYVDTRNRKTTQSIQHITRNRTSTVFEVSGELSNISMILSDKDIFVANTFKNNFEINGQSYLSEGSFDLIITKLGFDGNIKYVNHFGSKSEITIKDIQYDGRWIYLGGEIISWDSKPIRIGEKKFIVESFCDTVAYVTHMLDKNYINPNINREYFSENTETKNVTIYPNPAMDVVTFQFAEKFKDFNKRIEVLNASNSLIKVLETKNEKEIVDIRSYPNGVYYIKVVFPDGSLSVQKLIKI